jgi:hypothetical protein
MLNFMVHRIHIEPPTLSPGTAKPAHRLRPGVLALSLIAALLVNACGWILNSPEARARDFITGLIIQSGGPQPIARAGVAFASATPPQVQLDGTGTDENRLDDLETRVTIEYLRAKHEQGVELAFGYAGVHRRTAKGRIVTIVVTEPKGAFNDSAGIKKIFRFRVRLRETEDGWQIASVTSRA